MGFSNQSWWRPLVVPGGLLLGGAGVFFSSGLIRLAPVVLSSVYGAVFVCGLLLAWRFHSGRMFAALILLLLARRAIGFFASGRVPAVGPGRTALEAVAFLLALDLVWIGFSRERGFNLSAFAPKLAVLFVQAVFVAVICRPRPAPGADLFHRTLLPTRWLEWTHIAQIPFLAFLFALVFLLVRFATTRKPIDAGLVWTTLAAAIAIAVGGSGSHAGAYFATAGLILVVSIIEASYRMAFHDELTGLPSRRAWNDATAHLDAPYTIAVVDIDHFKQVNDVYGHETGDEVLRMVAGRLATVQGGGEAFRIGGEEFTILFRGIRVADALPHLEAVHRAVASARFRLRGGERRSVARGPERRRTRTSASSSPRQPKSQVKDADALAVTVSIGVAEGSEGERIERVVVRADESLYRAKANGRNRIELDGRSGGAKPPRTGRSKVERN